MIDGLERLGCMLSHVAQTASHPTPPDPAHQPRRAHLQDQLQAGHLHVVAVQALENGLPQLAIHQLCSGWVQDGCGRADGERWAACSGRCEWLVSRCAAPAPSMPTAPDGPPPPPYLDSDEASQVVARAGRGAPGAVKHA